MYTVTYYKFGNRWFLDMPEFLEKGGDEEQLERFGAFHDFLDWMAAGEETLLFHMDSAPFEGADVFELVGSSGGHTGGYYRLTSYQGQPVEYELWFNTLLYLTQASLPAKIFFKKVA